MTGLHVSGVLVRVRAGSVARACTHLESLPGVSVEAAIDAGRIIVIIEHESAAGLADTFHAIHETSGVLSASLVYHYSDEFESCEEETGS